MESPTSATTSDQTSSHPSFEISDRASRLAQFAARLVETGWLAALIVVPVFFNVWSNRVFEPDKLTLLRSIALVVVVAAAVWFAESSGRLSVLKDAVKRAFRVPLVAPVLALTAAYALSTALSIVPRQSLTGSYQRLQGLYTWLAYIVIFLAIVAFLRRRGQLDRLLSAMIVTSLPVALYGIIQSRGLDPMPWLGDVTFRVASTMGNSIFVAAYLVIVAPLTLVKAFEALRSLDNDDGEDGSALYVPASVLRAAAYMVLFLVQIIGIVLSQSRGPALGLGGALFVLVVLAAALHHDAGKRRWLTAAVYLGFGVLPAAFLLAFNLAGDDSRIASLRDAPYIGRMGRVFETEGGTGKVRVLIWDGAIDLITSDPLRAIVGYGPESMHVAYNPYYPPELAHYESRNASPDRSHNETLDSLATTGVLGFAAYIALFTSLFYFAMKWLGLLLDRRDRILFLLMWFGGGIVAALVFYWWRGDMTFVGVALPAGMVAGLVNYVALRAVLGWKVENRPGRLIVAGLTAAIVAHFIETNFGISIAATRTLFFAMAGTMVVVGGMAKLRPELLSAPGDLSRLVTAPVTAKRKKRSRAPRAPRQSTAPVKAAWTSYGLLMLVLLATMVFDFFVRGSFGLDDPSRRIEFAVMVWLFTLTWGVGSLPLISEVLTRPGGSTTGVWRFLGVSVGGSLLYIVMHQLVLRGGRGGDTSSSLIFLYYIVLFLILSLLAYALTRLDPEPETLVRGRMPWLYGAVAVAVVVLMIFTNINEVRADVYYKEAWAGYHSQAGQFQAQGDETNANAYFDGAVKSYDKAMGLDKSEDYYLLFKGKALLERADGKADDVDRALPSEAQLTSFSEYDTAELADVVRARDEAFARAMTVLTQAHELATKNTDHAANLGRAYQVWGERTYDAERRSERLSDSREWFETAISLSPNNAGLRTEMATTDYLAGDTEAALSGIEDALLLDDQYGRPYRLRATIHRELGDWEDSQADYERFVETRDGKRDAVGWSGLAYVRGKLKDIDGAIEANTKVLELAPGDTPTMRNLVLLYRDMGDIPRACMVINNGLARIPDEASLIQLSAELGCDGSGVGSDVGPGRDPSSETDSESESDPESESESDSQSSSDSESESTPGSQP